MARLDPLWIAAGAGLVAFVLIAYWRRWQWTGFVTSQPPDDDHSGPYSKTLWDWLRLLLVPTVLIFAAAGLNAAQADRERDRSVADQQEQRARALADQAEQRALALDNQREQLLKDYLDEMSALLLEKRSGDQADKAAALANTRTLSALRSLDGVRKGVVVRFLADTNMITGKPDLRDDDASVAGGDMFLIGADLRGADLRAASLCRLFLYAPDMTGAILDRADLGASMIMLPNLTDASLVEANISRTDLIRPNLERANFTNADLTESILNEAYGSDTNFTGADLRDSLSDLDGLSRPRFDGALVSPDGHPKMAIGLGAVEDAAEPTTGCLDIIPVPAGVDGPSETTAP